ncbi:hypothetical protein, partial [Prevotellamassilia timonensis]|uniref:hypothetical protein n=1 Tax=Prevotellamassilia timonensis TaxID=1852370 RepID=UPI00307B7CEA
HIAGVGYLLGKHNNFQTHIFLFLYVVKIVITQLFVPCTRCANLVQGMAKLLFSVNHAKLTCRFLLLAPTSWHFGTRKRGFPGFANAPPKSIIVGRRRSVAC